MMGLKKIMLSASILLFGLGGCLNKVKTNLILESDRTENINIQQDTLLDNYFSATFPENEPGGAVLVKVGETVLLSKGYGLSDVATKDPVTPKTLFNLGSISKTFVSNAILMLQADEKLSVEDDLLKYFPEFQNKEIARAVKIKHLLTHTSGLPDIRFPRKDSVFYLTAKDWENWIPIMKATRLNFEPGSKFEYSNPSFNALALIIEKVSGDKWQNFISKKIFLPAGMKASTITDGPHPESGVAHGYLLQGSDWREKDYGEEPTFAAAGNGGVWSSVEELELYHEALTQNMLLNREVLEDVSTIKTFSNWSEKQPPYIGWSWFIGKTRQGYKTVGHTGSQGGFRANYLNVPEKQWLIIILSSTPRNLEAQTNRILDYLQTGL